MAYTFGNMRGGVLGLPSGSPGRESKRRAIISDWGLWRFNRRCW